MGLIILVAQRVSIVRAKLWKIFVKFEIVLFFSLWVFPKMYIFEVATFYLAYYLSNELNFFRAIMYL